MVQIANSLRRERAFFNLSETLDFRNRNSTYPRCVICSWTVFDKTIMCFNYKSDDCHLIDDSKTSVALWKTAGRLSDQKAVNQNDTGLGD